ncbi:SDR family oxidoreductase [soil metagenome]
MSILKSMVPPKGLRVLVTAGASGIGRAIAEAFLEAGGRVHVSDIDEAALAALPEAMGRTSGDAGEEADVGRWMREVFSGLGGLDVLVNNAGIAGPTAGIDVISAADWRRTIDVNLNGQYLAAHRAVPLLRESTGVMINLASVAGRLAYPKRTPYAASKWAVVGLTKSLAAELGPEGVRVNAILPGVVRGKRIEAVIRDRAAALGLSEPEMERRYLEKVSLRRMVEPEDIAAMALYLSAPAGRNITGQAISVCGNVESL